MTNHHNEQINFFQIFERLIFIIHRIVVINKGFVLKQNSKQEINDKPS